jgi:hypothetical protein
MAGRIEKKMLGDHVAVIAVDIDGVIALNENLPMCKRKPPNIDIYQLLDKFIMRGYNVILYTSRDISRKIETEDWLFEVGILKNTHYHDIVYNKMKYDFIIDNKAINIGDPDLDKDCDLDDIQHIIDLCL